MVAANGFVVARNKTFHSIMDRRTRVEIGDPWLAEVGLLFTRQTVDDGRGRFEAMPVRRQMRIGVEHGDPRRIALPDGAGVAHILRKKNRTAGGAQSWADGAQAAVARYRAAIIGDRALDPSTRAVPDEQRASLVWRC